MEYVGFVDKKDKYKTLRKRLLFQLTDKKIAPASIAIKAYDVMVSYGVNYLDLPKDIRWSLQFYAHSDPTVSKKVDLFLAEIRGKDNNFISNISTEELAAELSRRNRLLIT